MLPKYLSSFFCCIQLIQIFIKSTEHWEFFINFWEKWPNLWSIFTRFIYSITLFSSNKGVCMAQVLLGTFLFFSFEWLLTKCWMTVLVFSCCKIYCTWRKIYQARSLNVLAVEHNLSTINWFYQPQKKFLGIKNNLWTKVIF